MKKRVLSVLLALMLIVGIVPFSTVTVQAAGVTLEDLKAKFPNGKYWNHTGNGNAYNNPDGWTDTPCVCHGQGICVAGSGSCTCNGYTSNGKADGPRKASQCMGFAYKLQQDVYGGNPYAWESNYDYISAMANLKPGDVVRYGGHSIFITYVNGNYIEYADCNSSAGGNCQIRWDAHNQTKSSLENSFQYVTHAPYELTTGIHVHSYSVTEFEAAHPHKEYKKCSCGDWQYTGNTIFVSGCAYCNDTCSCSTSYAGTYTTYNVSTVLRIRDAHSTSGNVIGEIPANAEFFVSKANGNWAHITYNGINGYVSQEYIKKSVATQTIAIDTRYPTPIKMYTLSNNHYGANAYFTYEDLLAAPATDGQFVYGDTDGRGDYVTINAVYTSHNVYLNCPWGNSTKDVYSFGSQFFYDMTVTPKKQTAEKTIYTYIRSGSSIQLGYVDPGDLIYILGSQNGYTQIIYPFTADGTYRCGWCLTSDLVHNHSYGGWSNYNSSVHMRSCVCGAEETASHIWNAGVVSKNATCTSSGIKVYTCTGCNATKTENIPTLEHNYTAGNYTDTAHPHTVYNICSYIGT